MDKRKGIILAIVLFLIIGLGTFVFAGSDEEPENGTIPSQQSGEGGNGSENNPSDSNEEINDGNLTGEGGTEKPSRDDVTTPVVDEVETPVTDGNNANTIDWASLLNELAQMVNTAEDRKDIEAAIEFRKNNNITAENIESLGETALDSLKTVNAILDDETAPAIEPDLDGKFFKEVSISINDDTKYTFVLERLDGESIPEGTTLDNINLEGEYKLTVVDAAFNETVVTFTIDRNETEETKTTMDVNNATHFDSIEDAVATITDLSLDKVVVENQDTKESVTFVAENGNVEIKLTEEATYKLTAYDKAGNETTYWLAVDETNPTIFFTDSEGNELSDLTNKDVTITAFDKFLTEVTVTDANGNETVYKEFTTNGNNENKTFTLTLGEDGIYTVTAKDKVGRTNTETIEIDKTKIEVNHLYVLNNSHNDSDYNLTDENRYKVIGNGQELYVEYVLKEEFTSTPVITIGGQEFEMNCGTASWDDSLYKCDAHITITKDMELENGEIIPFTITGVKDIAGNETTVTEENVTVTEKYGQVKFDGKAPKYNQLGILNVDHLRNDEDITVAKYGDEIRVLFHFTEELAVNPKMTIGESKKVYELELNEDYDNFKEYTYVADITLTEDMNLTDGALVYTIYGYADAAGNVGKTIKSTDEIKTYTKYPGVEIDNAAPNIELVGETEITVKYGESYEDQGVIITDNYDKEITPTYVIYYSETGEDGTFTTVGDSLEDIDTNKVGQYNIWYTATDAAGNTSTVRRIVNVEANDPIVELIGEDPMFVEVNSTFEDPGLNITDVFETETSQVVYYSENGEDGTFTKTLEEVDASVVGHYNIWYTVTNEYGKTAQARRTVIVQDTTAPIVTFSSNGGSSYNSEFNVEVTIEEYSLAEVYYVFTNAQTEEKVIKEKFNKGDATEVTELTDNKFVATLKNANGNLYLWVKAVDKLGNVSYTRTTNKFKIDTIDPVVNVEYSTTELTNGNIVVTLSANEPIMPVDAGTWNPNGAYASSLSKSYPSNDDQTIKVVDRAGNEVEVNIKITNIDKTIPYLEGLVNGTQALSVSLKAVDDNFDYIQLTNTETGRVINESREWTGFGGSEYVGKWTAQVFDKAGNGSEIYSFEILPERTTSLVDGVSYESLSDAVEAAKASGSTVELVDDITVSTSDYIEIKNGEVNIDLNGNNIMFESSRFSISDNGTLNLTGEGTISSNVAGGGPIYLSGSTDSSATAYANLNVGKDVTVEGNNGILIFTIDGKRGNAYGVNVNIDGTVRAIDVGNAPANIGVYVTGNLRNATTNAPIITLSETARVESGGVGIYAAGYATWNINGAYIEGAESAVGIKSGILNMNSGTLKANGTLNIPTEPFGNGMNSSGAALQIESNASYVGEMEINISGGRLISENAVAIYEYGQKDIDTKVQKINITGGEFISTNYKENFLFSTSFNDTFNNGFITGGTFNRNENDALLQYIADGYTVVEQDGNYVVVAE